MYSVNQTDTCLLNQLMFTMFHIYKNGNPLCHVRDIFFIDINDAEGMNPDNCCAECLHRYKNNLKMLRINSDLIFENTQKIRFQIENTEQIQIKTNDIENTESNTPCIPGGRGVCREPQIAAKAGRKKESNYNTFSMVGAKLCNSPIQSKA